MNVAYTIRAEGGATERARSAEAVPAVVRRLVAAAGTGGITLEVAALNGSRSSSVTELRFEAGAKDLDVAIARAVRERLFLHQRTPLRLMVVSPPKEKEIR